jgi:hypothetical protein
LNSEEINRIANLIDEKDEERKNNSDGCDEEVNIPSPIKGGGRRVRVSLTIPALWNALIYG